MEMTLKRAKELAATVLLDEQCPQGHRGWSDGLFGRAPLDPQWAYCPQCREYYRVTELTLVPMEFKKGVGA